MPFYRLHGTIVHVKLSGSAKSRAPAPCCARVPSSEDGKPEVRCMAISSILCDALIDGGTCDAPLCEQHAHAVGVDRHLCPIHAGQQAAFERPRQPELF